MYVTKIEPVTKTKYKVFIDGQFAFVLYKGELSRYHIAQDTEVDERLVSQILSEIVLKTCQAAGNASVDRHGSHRIAASHEIKAGIISG